MSPCFPTTSKLAQLCHHSCGCKKNNIKEFEWLKDIFERIQSHKHKDIYQLLPCHWEEYRIKGLL
ncbi:transposase domain-containing protein [Cyclobacterium lianum]|uniref:transposase domain-containing protein n=1 Tax=Cyclobacterium lianum TaxID=388280 RepID=UPI00093334C0|nr:transposase domain-containing protein [Cyclobacterium lianum]